MKSGLIPRPQLCWIGSAEDWQDVLRCFAGLAEQHGYAREGFTDALIQREEEFPTGLPMAIPVAIPHAYPEYVLNRGVGIALLDPPVQFREMGGEDDQWLSVRLVVLMLVTTEVAHNSDLSVIIDMFKDQSWYDVFSKAKTPEDLANCFQTLFDKKASAVASKGS